MKLDWSVHDLELKEHFGISRETYTGRKTVIVALSDGQFTGYGEISPNRYYNLSVFDITNALESKKDAVEGLQFCDPKIFWFYLKKIFGDNYFVISALDIAAYDLMGKISGKNILKSFQGSGVRFRTSYTIGLASIEEMVAKVKKTQWPLYKIKLGTKQDIAIIHEIRKVTDAELIVDANCAWTAEETIWKSRELKEMGVLFIEQPLPAENQIEMKGLRERSFLPLIADESCVIEKDVSNCAKFFDGINIKLAKCGGITPAYRMIKEAKKRRLKVMVGCMVESSIAISGAVPLLRYVDYGDLDGPMLLQKDLAVGLSYENGWIYPGRGAGLGVELIEGHLHHTKTVKK